MLILWEDLFTVANRLKNVIGVDFAGKTETAFRVILMQANLKMSLGKMV